MPAENPLLARNDDIGAAIFDEATIARRVRELGREINGYYDSGELLLVGLLKGSFIFLADLVRNIERAHKVDFCIAASYGADTKSSGTVKLLYEPDICLAGHHVLLVEDIVETGCTLNRLADVFEERGPESVEFATLMHKRVTSTLAKEPRFVGFDAPQEFLVGYGLDYDERYRHLPFVAGLKGQDG